MHFRGALELTDPSCFEGTCLSVNYFPYACCDHTSLLLATYLANNSFPGADIIRGIDGGDHQELNSHVWLELEGLKIDITADQFNRYGYENAPIIVEKANVFLSSFGANNMGLGDFRQFLLLHHASRLIDDFTLSYQTITSIIRQNS